MAYKIMHVGEIIKGGVYTYLYEVLKYQSTHQDNVIYLTVSDYKSEKDYPLPKDNIFYYKYKRNPFYILYAIIYIFILIKKIKPDIIHVHSTFAGLFVRLPYLFQLNKKVKIVYCPHGWSFLMETSNLSKRLYVLCEKILSIAADRIINISQFEQSQAINFGLPEKKMNLIYNGSAEAAISSILPDTYIENFNTNLINILFVGRFDRQKGIDILINAIKGIQNEKIHFYLVGDNVLDENKANSIEFPLNTTKIGWVNRNNIDQYYQLADAVIIPSRWEGFGLVAIEAMKNKKAVIASNRGALPELIQDDINGYLFDIRNISSLYSIIDKLDKSKLKELGEAGFAMYRTKFTSDKMNREIMNVYNSFLKK